MASAVFPAPSAGGGIKLVQRGIAASAGNITITGVDTTKAFVTFVSQGAAGTVATNSLHYGIGNNAGKIPLTSTETLAFDANNGSTAGWNRTLSGGTMDATTKQMGVYLSNSTTLVATGACRWEVVEFA